MAIEVSADLTKALHQSDRAVADLLEAAKSSDRERHQQAMKEWFAAQQRRRESWRAMATPLSGDAEKSDQ